PISEKHIEYARTVHGRLRGARVRAELDDRNEKLGYRIRDAQLRKVPYMLVVGAREAENGTVSLRHRTGDDLGAVSLERVLADLVREIGARGASLTVGRSGSADRPNASSIIQWRASAGRAPAPRRPAA